MDSADFVTTRMLEEQGQRLSEALTSPQRSTSISFPSYLSSPQIPSASSASVSNRSLEGGASSYDTQFLLPFGHSATLLRLLSLPPLRAVVGDVPKTYFLDLEESAGLPHLSDLIQPAQIDWPSLEPNQARAFATAFFNEVSLHIPLITKDYFESLQNCFFQSGPSPNVETAICYCIWALGCLASSPNTVTVSESVDDPPLGSLSSAYFAAAMRIITPTALLQLTSNVQTCQALTLAAMYFSSLGRPLHSWKLVQIAAQQLLEILST